MDARTGTRGIRLDLGEGSSWSETEDRSQNQKKQKKQKKQKNKKGCPNSSKKDPRMEDQSQNQKNLKTKKPMIFNTSPGHLKPHILQTVQAFLMVFDENWMPIQNQN